MEVRTQILEEATRLMAERGFGATSLQSIADAVGVKKPSVLYHFPSKEALKRAVLDDLLSRWNDVLPRLLMASARTGLAKFDSVMDELARFFIEDPDRARLIVRELLDRPDRMKNALEEQVRPWVDVVASYVKKGQELGQIQSDVDPEAYVLLIACLALSTFATSQTFAQAIPGRARRSVERRAKDELIRIARNSLFVESYLSHNRSP